MSQAFTRDAAPKVGAGISANTPAHLSEVCSSEMGNGLPCGLEHPVPSSQCRHSQTLPKLTEYP